MKKLEIKHLAPYFPYGLMLDCELEGYENEIKTLFTISNSGAVVTQPERCVYLFGDVKPILRPLSDLTKEIEHNGERFVPIKQLSKYTNDQTSGGKNGLEWGIIETFPYSDLIKLFEWHFDVFGLIDQGLAININDIE